HPTIFYGDGVFSADFPGVVRNSFRNQYDENLTVLFLNGAQGDISMENMMDRKSETDEEKIHRVSKMVFQKTMDLYHTNIVYDENPILRHVYEDLKVGVRLPSSEIVAESREVLSRIDEGENIRGMEMIMAFGSIHLQEKYGDAPF